MTNISAFTTAPALATRSSFTPINNVKSPRGLVPTPTVTRRTSTLRMAFSSINRILTPDPVSVPNDISVVITRTYNQVLGNAYLMESEREELTSAESQFKQTKEVSSFVRAIALSDAYKSRFFYPVSQYRFIELAFKHLLGRAASSKMEYAQAMAKYHNEGYDACIAWFLDSEEYDENFGVETVPYGIYKGCYPTNETFNRSVAMRLTPSSSDKGRSTMLQYCVLSGDSPSWLSIAKGLPPGTEKGNGFTVGGHWTSTQRNKNAPIRKGTKIPGGVVYYG